MTVGDALREASTRLRARGVDAPRRNAEWMLGHLLDQPRASLYGHYEDAVTAQVRRTLLAMVERRGRGEPLQYILGSVDFLGLQVQVTPAVLIPRPETEEVVLHALALIKQTRSPAVIDLCTGSGCIALAVRKARPDATVLGVDLSEDALEVAARNARGLGLDVSWLTGDVLDAGFPGRVGNDRYDLLISNPPYVGTEEAPSLAVEVREFEPACALFAGGDALGFYRAIAAHGSVLLRKGGWVVFEVHAERGDAVCSLLDDAGYADVRLTHDLAGLPRIVSARVSTRPGPGTG